MALLPVAPLLALFWLVTFFEVAPGYARAALALPFPSPTVLAIVAIVMAAKALTVAAPVAPTAAPAVSPSQQIVQVH